MEGGRFTREAQLLTFGNFDKRKGGEGSFENSGNIVLINLKYLIIYKYRNMFR